MHHDIKAHPRPFNAAWDGLKPFELRKNDRNYREGDTFCMREWEPDLSRYSGFAIYGEIKYVVIDIQWGLQPGYCAFHYKELRRAHNDFPKSST